MTRCFTPRACAGRHARLRCRHLFCRGCPIWQLSVKFLQDTFAGSGKSEHGTCGWAHANSQKNPRKREAVEEKGSGKRGNPSESKCFSKKISSPDVPSWPTAIFELLADGADSLGESDLDRQTVETPSRDRYADATRFHDSLVQERGRRGDNFRPRTPIRRSRTRGWRCIAIGRTWRCS